MSRNDSVLIDLIDDDVSLVVTRTNAIDIGHYLGVYLDRINGLSKETNGVMGIDHKFKKKIKT